MEQVNGRVLAQVVEMLKYNTTDDFGTSDVCECVILEDEMPKEYLKRGKRNVTDEFRKMVEDNTNYIVQDVVRDYNYDADMYQWYITLCKKEVNSNKQEQAGVLAQPTRQMVRMYDVNGRQFISIDMKHGNDTYTEISAQIGMGWVQLLQLKRLPESEITRIINEMAQNYEDYISVVNDSAWEACENSGKLVPDKWYILYDECASDSGFGEDAGRIMKVEDELYLKLNIVDGKQVYKWFCAPITTCVYHKGVFAYINGKYIEHDTSVSSGGYVDVCRRKVRAYGLPKERLTIQQMTEQMFNK